MGFGGSGYAGQTAWITMYHDLPAEFVALYNLNDIVDQNGKVYVRIQKGMYVLPQAGILEQQQLEQQLNKHGYHQSPLTLTL